MSQSDSEAVLSTGDSAIDDSESFSYDRRKNSYDLGKSWFKLEKNVFFVAIKFGEIDCGSIDFDKGFLENPNLNHQTWKSNHSAMLWNEEILLINV